METLIGSIAYLHVLRFLPLAEGRFSNGGVYPPIKRSDFISQHQSLSLTPLCHLSFLRQQMQIGESGLEITQKQLLMQFLLMKSGDRVINAGSLRHHSQISTTLREWKELVDQWVNTTKEIAGAQGTPESANPSVVDEEEEHEFPSLPYGYGHISSRRQGFDSADRWCRRHEP
ncbi:Uncharacterized protein Rs2_40979 [Raphanus sativus]|nr:Uncharacterized protein Rs2_40979 [Raphanus sativus]